MSCVQIWQSPFMKFFLSQQQQRLFRSQAASTIIINVCALILVAYERQWQLCFWLLPSLANYSKYHSSICLGGIVLFSYNILNFTLRYLHCCYRLGCKFDAASATEKKCIDLSASFHRDCTAAGTPPLSSSPNSPKPASPPSPLDRVYLPSTTPGKRPVVRHQLQQLRLSSSSPPQQVHQLRSPSAAAAAASLDSSGDLSVYFSPPRNLSRLSASLLMAPPAALCTTPGAATSQLQANSPPPDFSHLARLRYQAGTPGRWPYPQQQQQQQQQSQSPQQPQPQAYQSVLSPEAALSVLGVGHHVSLDRWLQGIRVWLHASLVEPLARDVDRVNARLRELGAPAELSVGSASVQQLRQAAPPAVATAVGQILPYLAVCEDQGYLVRRLNELASLHCLGAYRWDSGSPGCWSDRHPTDAALLMGLLSAYLDRCLPPLPGDAKPFTSVFLASSPTPSAGQQHQQHLHQQQHHHPELRILRASKQPPHYQLVMHVKQQQQILLDINPGSRNMFYCLLFFFHWQRARCGGRLGQVSLGEAGLNLAWIFEGGVGESTSDLKL